MNFNEQILTAVLALIVASAQPLRAWLLAKLSPQRIHSITVLASTAVSAAERLAEDVPGTTGAAKLNFASDFLVAAAKKVGVKLTTEEVLGYVHSALNDFKAAKALVSS